MSTLKVNNIQNANGTSAIAIDSSGVATFSKTLVPSSSMMYRNIIINGDMRIDQRNAGSSVTPTNAQYHIDRWRAYLSQASKYTVQQSTTAPSGFNYSLLATSSSAYTVGASDYFLLAQTIEGLNSAHLVWGTSDAKTVTLSFWVRSSLTGTFGGAVGNAAGNRSYPYSYTISSADTWEKKTITISGDTSGTWVTTNASSVVIYWSLGSGSSSSGTAGAWSGTYYDSVTGATSVVGTSGATFYITGVQLEVGDAATPFEHLPYDAELARCQRYYYKMSGASNYLRFATGFVGAGSTTTAYCYFHPPVTMRDKPTSIDWSASIGLWGGGAISAISALAIETGAASTTSVNLQVTSTGLTQYTPMFVMGNNSSTASIAVSAEL